MATRKSVDKILDQAADILERDGFTTTMCYNPDTGGFCALGAIARAAYPKSVSNDQIDGIAYDGTEGKRATSGRVDPRYVESVQAAALTITRRKALRTEDRPATVVYEYNDSARSLKQVVKMLRRAAENVRKAAAK